MTARSRCFGFGVSRVCDLAASERYRRRVAALPHGRPPVDLDRHQHSNPPSADDGDKAARSDAGNSPSEVRMYEDHGGRRRQRFVEAGACRGSEGRAGRRRTSASCMWWTSRCCSLTRAVSIRTHWSREIPRRRAQVLREAEQIIALAGAKGEAELVETESIGGTSRAPAALREGRRVRSRGGRHARAARDPARCSAASRSASCAARSARCC